MKNDEQLMKEAVEENLIKEPMTETVNIHGKAHPTYAGVLTKAHASGLKSIITELIQAPLDTNRFMAIVKATVTTEKGVFSGIGDATPKNVNSMIAPHIVRMAETRAKGRALRDALNIGEALKEEMGGSEPQREPDAYEKAVSKEKCRNCKTADMVLNPKTGKWFCSDRCWLK